MFYPDTYKSFRRTAGDLPYTIEQSQETLPPELGPTEVVIKIRAVSLNYRDVAMLIGTYPVPYKERGIPASDCAAEVFATGSEVENLKVGDAVAPITGVGIYEEFDDAFSEALGADTEGVLREYAAFDQKHLVHLPKNMSWEEGSMLPCAEVTAWNALDAFKHVPKNASALLQGTRGVSGIVLLMCVAGGIRPIITSSSEEKLRALQQLHPEFLGINYKITKEMGAEVKRLTDGRGVDFVINNTGPQSIPEDIGFLCGRGGTVSLVGFLYGFDADWEPKRVMDLMMKSAKIKGIAVGSKADFEDMNRWLEVKKVKLTPALDRVFSFSESKEAFDYLYSGKHTGKIVIKFD